MSNKFVSWLSAAEKDFAKGLNFVLHIAETSGEVAVATFAPQLGPLFNSTVSAVVLAGQKYAALGQQKAGTSKLADVLSLMEPVIAQGLADAGKASDTAAVTDYIKGVVAVLNAAPATA